MSLTAILLAGGYATRLYPLTQDKPKALLPLGEGVILDAVVNSLEGVPDISRRLLVTNHRFAEQFRAWQRHSGQAIRILDDGSDTVETRLGAIRDLELARTRGHVEDDVLVLGTDNLFTWPLAEFIKQAKHRLPDPSVALWLAPTNDAATHFGVVTRDASSRITAFTEKSPQPPSREVALCVYYFPGPMCGKIREFLDGGGNADAPGYFIQWLAARGSVYGIMMSGLWYDIGTSDAYQTVVSAWPHQSDSGDHTKEDP
ncbi:MAG: nucleotidyltransferase family protein [Candidatus Omnitrophota bacterium]|nr:nucleotidyltransferase family protein [Candidatus Omnitrophota bacterium]